VLLLSSSSLPSTQKRKKKERARKLEIELGAFATGTYKTRDVRIIMSNETSSSETTPLRRPETQSPYNVAESGRQTTVNTTHTHGNGNNNNYGDSVEVRLQEGDRDSTQQQQQQTITMDTNKRILCRVGLDILILLCGK